MTTGVQPVRNGRDRVLVRLGERIDPRILRLLPLAGVVAVFAGTRLALFRRFPPFLDESLYASWALRVHDTVNDRFVALAYGKLPLLSWLGAGLVFAGFEPLDAVRLVSLSAGLASMIVAALLAARLGGRAALIAAAGSYTLLPLALVHDVIGIMEPLVGALLVVALYLQLRLAEQPRWSIAFLLGLAMGAGVLTKETGEIALVLFPASLLVFDWRSDGRARRLLAWIGCAVSATALAGIAYLVLTLSDLWDDYPKARESLGTSRSFHAGLSHPLRWIASAWPDYRTELLGYTTVPVAIALVAGIVFAIWRHRRLAILYLLWLVAPLVVDVLFLPNTFVRYLVPMAPLIAVFAGYGVSAGAHAAAQALRRPRQAGWVTAAVALVIASTAVVFDARVLANPSTAPYPGSSREEYATGWAAGTGWRSLARELRRRAEVKPIVVASYAALSEALPLILRHDSTIQLVRGQPGRSGAEATADYVVENGTPPPAGSGFGVLRRVWTFRRPAGGVPIFLDRRGVVWQDRFYPSPDALRAGLALPDRAFDRFIASHPAIRDWYVAESSRK